MFALLIFTNDWYEQVFAKNGIREDVSSPQCYVDTTTRAAR